MEVMIHKKIDILEEILPEWNILQQKFRDITIFQDLSWLKGWWESKRQK